MNVLITIYVKGLVIYETRPCQELVNINLSISDEKNDTNDTVKDEKHDIFEKLF